jgi:2-polyprenyl-3-methyl-5-hydroxy-6-metoxy-1,4-benzoquinol methylase
MAARVVKRIPDALLARMAEQLSEEDRDEMAIPSYRHPNPLMRWMAWRRVEAVARRLEHLCSDGRKDRIVVDFGCGTGILFEQALRCARMVVGVDLVLDAARLLAAEWRLDVELKTPDQAKREIEPGSIDIVIAAEVLEHVQPLEETLALFKTWLRKDGRLLVSLPTENRLYRFGRRLAGFQGHYHHDDAKSIDRAIRQTGFRRRSRSSIPLPGPFAIYWVADYLGPT